MQRFTLCALFLAATAAGTASALAQSVPEGQSCGGLLCDMGVFGHKTEPAPAAPPPAPADTAKIKKVEAVPDASDIEPKKPAARKKKHVAKAQPAVAPAVTTKAVASTAPAARPAPTPSPTTDVAARPALPDPFAAAAGPPDPITARPVTAVRRVAAKPVAPKPVAAEPGTAPASAILNPYAAVQAPAVSFRPLY